MLYPLLVLSLGVFFEGCAEVRRSATEGSYAAAIIGPNTMESVKPDASNIPASARLLTQAIGRSNDQCTVFHLGEGLAVTAAHCFAGSFSNVAGAPCQSTSITWGEVDQGQPSLVSRCIRIEALEQSTAADFAIIRIDPVPAVSLRLAQGNATDGAALAVLGYPLHEALQFSSDCTIVAAESEDAASGFHHDCDTLPGHSGSPVLRQSDWAVVGIHDGGDSINYGTLLSDTPAGGLLAEAARNSNAANDQADATLSFGPFGENENRLLLAITTQQAAFVSLRVETDIEETYDKVMVVDGYGQIRQVSGLGAENFSRLKTPVIVVFQSDYAGTSKSVRISSLNLFVN